MKTVASNIPLISALQIKVLLKKKKKEERINAFFIIRLWFYSLYHV